MPDDSPTHPELDPTPFEWSPDPVWLFDLESLRLLYVNAAAVTLYGYSSSELLAMRATDLSPGDGADRVVAAAARMRAAASPDRFREVLPTHHRTRDGRSLSVEVSASIVRSFGRRVALFFVRDMTRHRAAEEALEQSERRFRAVVENGSEGVAIVDHEGTVLYASPRTAELLGAGATLSGKRVFDFLREPDGGEVAGAFAAFVSSGVASRASEYRVASRGAVRFLESAETNLRDDPSVAGILVSLRDVSDRRRADLELREARQRLASLISATSAVIYSARPSGSYATTFMGDNVVDLTGYEASEFLRRESFWSENVHPDDRPAVLGELETLFRKGRHTFTYRFRHKGGAYRWLHDDAVVVRDDDGVAKELIGVWTDVTERLAAEEAVRRSEASFRSVIEHTPVAILVHRADRIEYANPALVAMLGYHEAAALEGRRPVDIVHPDDREKVGARIREIVRRGGRNAPLEMRFIRRDGSIVLVECEGLLLEFDGHPAVLVLARDLTERHELFARLALADRMLAVGALAAAVAHEINNPLAYVLMNLGLLVDQLPPLLSGVAQERAGRVRRMVTEAYEGADRVRAIVRDLRTLSRTADEAPQPVDVREPLESAIRMAGAEIRHRARLSVSLAETPPVLGTAARLGQVFLNLVVNAAHAMREGAGADANEIRVSTRAAAGRVIVDVEDNGSGIPAEILGHIFDPFFTTKPVGVGTGLGLSICRSIVRSLDGEITVRSVSGQGSTFTVDLPAATIESVRSSRIADAEYSRRGRVLVIDDEARFAASLKALLGTDHDVVALTRATDALERLRVGERFDAIVCDLMMPEMSGGEFYERLLSMKPALAARIIFLTGGAFTPQSQAFLARSSVPWLEKPVDPHVLRAALDRVLVSAAEITSRARREA